MYQTVTRFDFSAPTTHGQPLIQSFINEIDLETGTSLTQPVLAKASPLGVAEGCHILKKDGFYYFFTAEGGTQDGHRECVYRSTCPTGPFEAPPEGINPVIFNDNHPDIQNTGHMDLIEGVDDQWVAVFLGVRPVFEAGITKEGGKGMPTHLGRETFMAPMEWVDGWPVVNNRKPIELIGDFPGLELAPEPAGWIDEFDTPSESRSRPAKRNIPAIPAPLTRPALNLGWYHIRVPLRQYYSLTERPGYLALRGGPITLDTEHSPSALLQKQPGFNLDWSTEVEFTPTLPGQEAGTVVWMSKGEHASLGLRGIDTEGNVEVAFKRPSADGKFDISTFPLPSTFTPGTPVTFYVHARTQQYEFSYSVGGAAPVVVGTMASSELKPLFTGVHLGVFAQGAKDMPCINRAYFKYAKWDSVAA